MQLNTQTWSGRAFRISPSTARTNEVMNAAKYGLVILLFGSGTVSMARLSYTRFSRNPWAVLPYVELLSSFQNSSFSDFFGCLRRSAMQ